MLNTSGFKYPVAKVGDTVRVKVTDVDWARSDGRNILATVVEITDVNFYKLSTK